MFPSLSSWLDIHVFYLEKQKSQDETNSVLGVLMEKQQVTEALPSPGHVNGTVICLSLFCIIKLLLLMLFHFDGTMPII